jgi:hypothetical protein
MVCVFLLLSAAIFDILIHSYRKALSVFRESLFDWENPAIEINTRKEKHAFFIALVCYFIINASQFIIIIIESPSIDPRIWPPCPDFPILKQLPVISDFGSVFPVDRQHCKYQRRKRHDKNYHSLSFFEYRVQR